VTFSGRAVEIALERGAGFNVDGELVDTARLLVTATPRAFEVVVP
jgi:hypothetical protein